ncbi:PRC-barrel domain containing protein [Auraticoccus sp. F435]|uniref:PRC-barrel domain containing protein n=1 Tax=Auraticoccus cholistanensis TaxID=2656650 RepID=A0A6A9UX37_9ACTN|nr:PRC-barrel domain-containing protein [Auraticoccus cholistanensis]MVA75807.1 PRC-barrel domain containing protein [Auraticoccus cholistanensis]
MVTIEDIRDWVDEPVVDASESRIGTLESIYYDTATEEPTFAAVKTGLLGGARLVFVPLEGATVTPRHLKVTVLKKLAREAPSIPPDGQLAAAMEPEIYAHYGMPYSTGANGERRLGRR